MQMNSIILVLKGQTVVKAFAGAVLPFVFKGVFTF